MPVSRREFALGGVLGGGAWVLGHETFAAGDSVEPEVGDNGLYSQPWFLDSFFELKNDLLSAAEGGKLLAILFEQRGCPYCRELHKVNFARKEIRQYLDANFDVLQLDMWGSREVTDFDGKKLSEKALAQRWRVVFTPTMVFFPNDPTAVDGKTGSQIEVARMPGYFKPFHFLSMLQYVREGRYGKQHFQRFLQDKFKKLKAEGKTPDVW